MDQPNPNKQARIQRRNEALCEYRRLIKELKETKSKGDQKALQYSINQNLQRVNQLWPLVKRKLEGAATDSRFIKEITEIAFDAAKKVNSTKSFDFKRTLLQWFRDDDGKKLTKKEFHEYISTENSTCFKRAPSYHFFYGTLRQEDNRATPKVRRVRQKLVEKEAVTAIQRDLAAEVQTDNTPKEVEHIYNTIKEASDPSFYKHMVDPNSFSRTVENLFHVSFLVKEGKVGLKRDKDKKVVIDMDSEDGPQNQSILSFTMDDYRKWVSEQCIVRQR